MLLDLWPLFEEETAETGGPYPNPLPRHQLPRRLRDDEEAVLVAALI